MKFLFSSVLMDLINNFNDLLQANGNTNSVSGCIRQIGFEICACQEQIKHFHQWCSPLHVFKRSDIIINGTDSTLLRTNFFVDKMGRWIAQVEKKFVTTFAKMLQSYRYKMNSFISK